MKKRTKPTDIPDDAAKSFFENNVPLAANPNTLWAYKVPKGRTKPAVQWAFIKKLRSTLSELLEITGGRVVKQQSFHRQFAAFLRNAERPWLLADTESCVYQLRMAMSALLSHKTNGKTVPTRYAELTSLMDKIHVSDGSGAEAEDDNESQAGSMASDSVIVLSSQSTVMASPKRASVEDIASLHAEMFGTPSPKKAKLDETASTEKNARFDDEAFDELLQGCSQRGPLPAEYTVFRKPATQPA